MPDAAALLPPVAVDGRDPRLAGLSSSAARRLGIAAQALSMGQIAAAEQRLPGLLEVYPDHPEVLRMFAALLSLRGDPSGAIVTMQRALAQRPDDAAYWSSYGSALIDASGPGSGGSRLPAAVAATELDVRLDTVGPLGITNSVARLELQPDLQLTGTVSEPALRGQVAVGDDGRIQVGGRQYRLRDSRLEFSPEQGLMPRLAVAGETRVGDYTVFLRLSGPASEIETALSSDPPLGERDLQTLLVTGQREELGRGAAVDLVARLVLGGLLRQVHVERGAPLLGPPRDGRQLARGDGPYGVDGRADPRVVPFLEGGGAFRPGVRGAVGEAELVGAGRLSEAGGEVGGVEQHQAEALVPRRHDQRCSVGKQPLPDWPTDVPQPSDRAMLGNRNVRRSRHHEPSGARSARRDEAAWTAGRRKPRRISDASFRPPLPAPRLETLIRHPFVWGGIIGI